MIHDEALYQVYVYLRIPYTYTLYLVSAPLWLFSELGANYKYSDLLTYLPTLFRDEGIILEVDDADICAGEGEMRESDV